MTLVSCLVMVNFDLYKYITFCTMNVHCYLFLCTKIKLLSKITKNLINFEKISLFSNMCTFSSHTFHMKKTSLMDFKRTSVFYLSYANCQIQSLKQYAICTVCSLNRDITAINRFSVYFHYSL